MCILVDVVVSRLIRRGLGGEFESLSNTHRTTIDDRYVHGVVLYLHTFPYFHTHKRNLYFATRTLISGYDVYVFINSFIFQTNVPRPAIITERTFFS